MDHNNYCIASLLQHKPYYFYLSTMYISFIHCDNQLKSLHNQLSCHLRFLYDQCLIIMDVRHITSGRVWNQPTTPTRGEREALGQKRK